MRQKLFFHRVSFTTGKILLAAAALALSGAARAQWIFTGSNSPWFSEANTQFWNNNEINDRFIGASGPIVNQQTLSSVAFDAGSTTVNLSGFDARKLAVGQAISGAGIPTGATIAAINNAGQITISAPTLSASGGPLTVSGWGAYNGFGTLSQSVSLSYSDGSPVFNMPSGFDYSTIKLGLRITGNGIDANIIAIDQTAGTITLNKNYAIGANPPTGPLNFTFNALTWDITLSGTHNVAGDFVYFNTDPYGISFTPTNANPAGLNNVWNFTAPVTNFVVDIGGSGTQRSLTFGSNSRGILLDFKGGDVNFIIDPTTNLGSNFGQNGKVDLATLAVSATNLGALNKSGAGSLTISGAAGQLIKMNGPVTVSGGQLLLMSDGQLMTGPRIVGATRYDVIGLGSALVLYINNAAGGQVASIPSLVENVPVNLWSGQVITRSNSTVNDSQTIGTLALKSGRNSIANADGVANFTLNIGALNRENYATLNILGKNIGTGPYVKVTNDTNILNNLIGGGGAAGSKDISIIPWVTMAGSGYTSGWTGAVQGDSYSYGGIDLATYTHADGFRALAAAEYDNTFAAAKITGANSNVWLTGNTTLGSGSAQTINALKLNQNMTLTLNDTLTVSSGVLIKANGSDSTISGGVIDSGANPLYVYGPNKLTISAQLTNSYSGDGPGLILAQFTGSTVLGSANSYGGSTLVQGAASVMAVGAIANNELRVDLGGLFSVDGNSVMTQVTKLSGNGTVNLNGLLSQLNIGGAAGDMNAVTVNAGGILAPGDADGRLQTGTLLLGDHVESLVFTKDSFLDLDLASDTLSDMIASVNPFSGLTLSDGAILRLNFLNGYTPTDEVSWLLTSGFDTINLGKYLIQDMDGNPLDDYTLTSINHNLMLNFSAIPEPATLALLLSGATLLALLRRRSK